MIDSTNDQFIKMLISSSTKDIQKFFNQEDQKYIIWKQKQILQKMPKDLYPNNQIQYASNNVQNLKKIVNQSSLSQHKKHENNTFPTMFNNLNSKLFQHQEYQQKNQHMYKVETGLIDKINLQQKSIIQNGLKNEVIDGTFLLNNIQMTNLSHSSNRFNQVKKYAPFVSASHNFNDLNSNSKGLNNFMRPQTNAHNMLQYTHDKKIFAFSNNSSYPNMIMKGNIENPFDKTFQKNQDQKEQFKNKIINVKKYTLNVQSKLSNNFSKIQNPFVRKPSAYQNIS